MLVMAVAQYISSSCCISSLVILGKGYAFWQVQVELIEGDVLTAELAVYRYGDYASCLQCDRRYGDALARWY